MTRDRKAKLQVRVVSDLGCHNCPASGKSIGNALEQMPAQGVLGIKTAITLNLSLINQFGIAVFDIIDQKTLGMTEVLVDLLTIFRCDCDQHTTPPLRRPPATAAPELLRLRYDRFE